MGKKQTDRPRRCTSCGDELVQKDAYTLQCTSCGREYYLSADRTHRVSIHLSVGKMIFLSAMAVIAVTAFGVFGYQYYTGRLVSSASRFSVTFRDFLMEAYGKPVAEIGPEDLEKIRYLKIEKEGAYRFSYSFADPYDYPDLDAFQDMVRTVEVKGSSDDFSPTNVQYFTGLTKLELYVDAWENYVLPEENGIRSISCTDGLSRYGTPRFFEDVDPERLEEVTILEADQLTDFSFMEDLRKVRRLTLSGAVLKDVDMFQGFDRLEELTLKGVSMEEEETYKLIRELLELPSMRAFSIEGKTGWYVTDGEWEELEQEYGGRVTLQRE